MLLAACCADQDSVRLLAVESCGAFAQALTKEDCTSSLLPVVLRFAQVGLGIRGDLEDIPAASLVIRGT